MNYILLLILILIVYVYISYYYRYPTVTKVLHAYNDRFQTSLLMEKHPIVLLEVEATQTLEQLKEKHLPYLFAKQTHHIPSVWNTNRSKYLFLHSELETEIHLLPASKKLTKEHVPDPEETLITLQIQPSQVVILPFHWHYYSDVPLRSLGVHDYLSWLLP